MQEERRDSLRVWVITKLSSPLLCHARVVPSPHDFDSSRTAASRKENEEALMRRDVNAMSMTMVNIHTLSDCLVSLSMNDSIWYCEH